jgi:2-isopropylmalate synthase
MEKTDQQIIYDWNAVDSFHQFDKKNIFLFDETLRDGLQSPSVRNPDPEEKVRMLHIMNDLGIDYINCGLPGSSRRSYGDVLLLVKTIADNRLRIKPCATARTLEDDIKPIIEISQSAGIEIEVMSFIGSSPIRQLTEDWDLKALMKYSSKAVDFARHEGLPVTFVTEDTTRSKPDTLYRLFANAIDHGANRLCITDTVGHATPDGIRALLRFVMNIIQGLGVEVGLDWHGHNDRGLSLANSMWAIQWGADRIHGTACGIGERVGNTPMDQLIVNLVLLKAIERDTTRLYEYCEYASKITESPIPPGYPVVGANAFRTSTGVHASAVIKAMEKGDRFLADRIYSGVPASLFGKEQEIVVGPMSGLSNVIFWLRKHGRKEDQTLAQKILAEAKSRKFVMRDEEIHAVIKEFEK